MTILLLDTAFDCCQAGLWRNGDLIAQDSITGEARHDVMLAPLVARLLAQHEISAGDLNAIAVTTGPGRFTSLRVGISFARALALPYQTPLYALPTGTLLHHYQRTLPQQGTHPVFLIAVKRGEIFAQTPDMAEPVMMQLADLPTYLADHQANQVIAMGAGINRDWLDAIPTDYAVQCLDHLPLSALGMACDEIMANSGAGEMHGQTIVRPFYGTSTGAFA